MTDQPPKPKQRKLIDTKRFVERSKRLKATANYATTHRCDLHQCMHCLAVFKDPTSFFDMSPEEQKEILDKATDDSNAAQKALYDKAQLVAIIEQVIGSDEVPTTTKSTELTFYGARNSLREEQRKRLKALVE